MVPHVACEVTISAGASVPPRLPVPSRTSQLLLESSKIGALEKQFSGQKVGARVSAQSARPAPHSACSLFSASAGGASQARGSEWCLMSPLR
jgi:hypothetical protein